MTCYSVKACPNPLPPAILEKPKSEKVLISKTMVLHVDYTDLMMPLNLVLWFSGNIPVTGLNTMRFDSTFYVFNFPTRRHDSFRRQCLMGNYNVSAWLCVFSTAATAVALLEPRSASRQFRNMYILLMRIRLNILRLYREIVFYRHHFEISDHAVTSQITIKKTWRRPGNLN